MQVPGLSATYTGRRAASVGGGQASQRQPQKGPKGVFADSPSLAASQQPLSMIRFPFWLLIPSEGRPAGADLIPLAFPSSDKLGDYLSAHSSGDWEVRLVNRYSLSAVVADVRRRGYAALDYQSNVIDLDTLLAQLGE